MCKNLKILFLIFILSLFNINLEANHYIKKNNEIRITNSDYSETDPAIAVNPIDPNNLISSSIQHKLNYGRDNYLNAISFSTNKGLTWQRYLPEVLPNEQYRLISDASCNNVLFDIKGKAHLVWLTTLIKTGFGGVDSIIQTITYRYSEDKGKNWKGLKNNIKRVSSNYNVSQNFNGLNENISSVKLFNNEYQTFISYTIFNRTENNLNIELINIDSPDEKVIIPLPDSINYVPNFDIKIKENKAHIVFLSAKFFGWNYQQYIGYYEFDFNKKEIINKSVIHNVNFMGSTLLLGVNTNNIPGLPTNRLNPNPLVNFINDSMLISWTGSNFNTRRFFPKNNIFITKGINGEFSTPKIIFEDTIHHQVNYDLKINNDNNILVHFYNLEGPFDTLNYNVEPKFMLSFDGETYTKPISYISNKYELIHTQNRNFQYGIGYLTNIDMDENHLYFTWTDGRANDGNTEIFAAVYPILVNYDELFNVSKIKIDVQNIYPNPFHNKICIDIENYKLQQIEISLYDFNGKKIETLYDNNLNLGDNHIELEIKNYAEGNYFLSFKTKNDLIYKRLIKIN